MSSRIVETALLCRDVYIDCRRRQIEAQTGVKSDYLPGPKWDGGERNGVRHKSVWPVVARFFLEHELDPVRCIVSRFQKSLLQAHALLPNSLASSKFLPFYKEIQQAELEAIKHSLATQRAVFMQQLVGCRPLVGEEGPVLWRHVLSDTSNELSPLFRFCIASSEETDPQLQKIASRFEPQARTQYARSPAAYNKFWSDILPSELARVLNA